MNSEQFEALLDEYRAKDIHFLHLKTNTRDWFFVIDDSYYLTYRDDKKEIVVSWLVKPKDNSHEEFYFYNTNGRSFNLWYGEVIAEFEAMDDRKFYNEPYYEDLYFNYLNEDEKVPLKDFLAVIPRTNYKIFGNYLLCDEIGSGFDKVEKSYKSDTSSIGAQIRLITSCAIPSRLPQLILHKLKKLFPHTRTFALSSTTVMFAFSSQFSARK